MAIYQGITLNYGWHVVAILDNNSFALGREINNPNHVFNFFRCDVNSDDFVTDFKTKLEAELNNRRLGVYLKRPEIKDNFCRWIGDTVYDIEVHQRGVNSPNLTKFAILKRELANIHPALNNPGTRSNALPPVSSFFKK
jgi:hypothetical protein